MLNSKISHDISIKWLVSYPDCLVGSLTSILARVTLHDFHMFIQSWLIWGRWPKRTCLPWSTSGDVIIEPWGFPESWGYPNSWMVFVRKIPWKSEWWLGVPPFMEPPCFLLRSEIFVPGPQDLVTKGCCTWPSYAPEARVREVSTVRWVTWCMRLI